MFWSPEPISAQVLLVCQDTKTPASDPAACIRSFFSPPPALISMSAWRCWLLDSKASDILLAFFSNLQTHMASQGALGTTGRGFSQSASSHRLSDYLKTPKTAVQLWDLFEKQEIHLCVFILQSWADWQLVEMCYKKKVRYILLQVDRTPVHHNANTHTDC